MKAVLMLFMCLTLFLLSNGCSDGQAGCCLKNDVKVVKQVICNFLKQFRLKICNVKNSDVQADGSSDANGQADGNLNDDAQENGSFDANSQTGGNSNGDEQEDGGLESNSQTDGSSNDDEQANGSLDDNGQSDGNLNADGEGDNGLDQTADGNNGQEDGAGGSDDGAIENDSKEDHAIKNDSNEDDSNDDNEDDDDDVDAEEDTTTGPPHNLLCYWCKHTCANQTTLPCEPQQNRCFYYHYIDDTIEKGCMIDKRWPMGRAKGSWSNVLHTRICSTDFCNYYNDTS